MDQVFVGGIERVIDLEIFGARGNRTSDRDVAVEVASKTAAGSCIDAVAEAATTVPAAKNPAGAIAVGLANARSDDSSSTLARVLTEAALGDDSCSRNRRCGSSVRDQASSAITRSVNAQVAVAAVRNETRCAATHGTVRSKIG